MNQNERKNVVRRMILLIAVVRPGADPRTVKHVFVITDY